MINKLIFYSKLGVSMVFSLVISWFLINNVFLFQSPEVRPHVERYLARKAIVNIKSTARSVTQVLPSFSITTGIVDRSITTPLQNQQVNQPSKGIYTKESDNLSYMLIKEDEVEWQQQSFDLDGLLFTINIPSGETPPTKEIIEKIY